MPLSGLINLQRPVNYSRRSFRIGTEKIGYSGVLFSQPAFAALLDKRLFKLQNLHPISSPIYLYYNRDSGLKELIQPSIDASGYQRATPHYANYILDIRDLLTEVYQLHAEDSDWVGSDYLVAQLDQSRQQYNLSTSSRSGVKEFQYVHKESTTLSPSNDELGASGLFDIDIEEIMWRSFPRPKNIRTASNGIPIEPIFPAVIKTDGLPEFSDLDNIKYTELGIHAPSSGGILFTGDRLLPGTKITFLTASGITPIDISDYLFDVPGAEYPCGSSLSILGYRYTTDPDYGVAVSGRRAIYATPTLSEGVYLINICEFLETSGYKIQHYPSNYSAISGIDNNGKFHNGLHVQNKLLFSTADFGAGQPSFGRSLINGKIVFAHFGGTDVSEIGNSFGVGIKYINNNTVIGFARVLDAAFGNEQTSRLSWYNTNNLLSPITWSARLTTALEPFRILFSQPPQYSTTYSIGDINASINDGVITRKFYSQWGTIDQIVYSDQDFGAGGQLRQETITFNTIIYRPVDIDAQGNIVWGPVVPPEISPVITTQIAKYFQDTFYINNVWTLFFARRPNHGFVHVNGSVYIQWSENTTPRTNKFAPLGTRSFQLTPATARSDVIRITGEGLRRFVTTNNQITIPNELSLTPAASTTITFAPNIPLDNSVIEDFGPAIWDPDTNTNYLYILRNNGKTYFAKMNTSFVITEINEVNSNDAVIFGRTAILSI